MTLKATKVKKTTPAQGARLLPKGRRDMAGLLLAWYDRNRRVMPWRALAGKKADPYGVWLSEIMLQQTTVAAVGPYFQKFIKRWPTLDDLGAASLDDVLRMWAGLGYYRRARMLHQCAQRLRDHFGGIFPSDEKTLLSLPGFGPYTAAAVMAIAFDKPANVVDGNVERVVARIFAVQEPMPEAKAKVRAAAATLLPEARHGDYAQALMDLGATVCTPRSPKCGLCPWQRHCKAKALDIQETLPRRIKAAAKPTRRAVAFVLLNGNGEVFLRPRPAEGLLGGMMEVPSSPWQEEKMQSLAETEDYVPAAAKWRLVPGIVTHVFTHFTLEVSVGVAVTTKKIKGCWILPKDLGQEAVPSVMKKIVHHALKEL